MAAERRIRNRRLAEDPRRDVGEGQRRRRRVTLVAAFVGVFVLVLAGILIAGYVIKFVLPPRQVIIKVNDVAYSRGDLVKLVRVQQRGSEFLGFPLETATEVFNVLQNLVQHEIMIQSAPQFGVTVTEEEIEQHIRALIMRRTSSDPGQAEREFNELYNGYLNAIQLSEDEHRLTIRRSLTRDKLVQFMSESVPRVAEQVQVYRLVMFDNEEFNIMEEKYRFATENVDNEDAEGFIAAFREVVREFSRDHPDIVRKNGEIGWMPRGILSDYDNVLFDLEVGQLSQRVPDYDREGVHFYFMIGEKEGRNLSDVHWNELKAKALTDWVNQQRKEFEVFSALNSVIYDWILVQLGFSELPDDLGTKALQPANPTFSTS